MLMEAEIDFLDTNGVSPNEFIWALLDVADDWLNSKSKILAAKKKLETAYQT